MSYKERLMGVLQPGDLNPAVFDVARKLASTINGAGIDGQVRYLQLHGLDLEDIAKRSNREVPPAPPAPGVPQDARWSNLYDRIVEGLKDQLGRDLKSITLDANFVDDLGCDSLDLVELLMTLEEELGVDIPDDDAEGLTTVMSVVRYLYDKGIGV